MKKLRAKRRRLDTPRKSRQSNVEILTIGNEILIGHTMDTNSNWIAQRLNEHSWTLQRITTVPDELEEIANSIREILRRKPRLIITLGGLGPTPDDMTLKAIARGLNRPVKVNVEALHMIRGFYRRVGRGSVAMTFARRKMATLPMGARPLRNPVGTAPGVLSMKGSIRIISLPGVPREMEAIFRESLLPILEEHGGIAPAEETLRIDGIVESAMAPAITRLKRAYPDIYFKSHPRGNETTGRPLIELHMYSLNDQGRVKIGEAASNVITELSRLSDARRLRISR